MNTVQETQNTNQRKTKMSFEERHAKFKRNQEICKQMAKELTGDDDKAIEEFMEFKKRLKKETKYFEKVKRKQELKKREAEEKARKRAIIENDIEIALKTKTELYEDYLKTKEILERLYKRLEDLGCKRRRKNNPREQDTETIKCLRHDYTKYSKQEKEFITSMIVERYERLEKANTVEEKKIAKKNLSPNLLQQSYHEKFGESSRRMSSVKSKIKQLKTIYKKVMIEKTPELSNCFGTFQEQFDKHFI